MISSPSCKQDDEHSMLPNGSLLPAAPGCSTKGSSTCNNAHNAPCGTGDSTFLPGRTATTGQGLPQDVNVRMADVNVTMVEAGKATVGRIHGNTGPG